MRDKFKKMNDEFKEIFKTTKKEHKSNIIEWAKTLIKYFN